MIEYYRAHPVAAVLVIAAVITAVVIFVKVAVASEKRAGKNQKLFLKLEEDKKLRERFANITVEIIASSDSGELFRGVGLNLLKRVADSRDMTDEFDCLTEEQKLIYSAFVLIEDSKEGLSGFFKINGKPVTDYAVKAAGIINPELESKVKFEYDAYDGDNENVSCIPSEIKEADNSAEKYLNNNAETVFGDYIKENSEKFI